MIEPATWITSFLAATRSAGAADAELLTRYVAQGDGAAFTALVARHGPMVFSVCRRVLCDWHLAEDAFQATFLVLARRAMTVSPPGALAGWLHGVAFRVAQAARRALFRRTRRERVPDAPLDFAAQPGPDTDLAAVIDGELRKLPGKYRELLIACDLEERPRRSVAAALSIPEGTLSSRLTAARKMLAGRLARRGVGPASVALVTLGNLRLDACEVSPGLLASAAKLGCGAAGTVSTAIAIDVKTREKTAVPLPNNHVITDWSRDGKSFLPTSYTEDSVRMHLMNRDGTEHQALTDKSLLAGGGRLSPDGKRVLCIAGPRPIKDQRANETETGFSILDIATGKRTRIEGMPKNAHFVEYCWGPDGKQIAYVWAELAEGKAQEANEKDYITYLVVCDPDGKNQKTVATSKALEGAGRYVSISGMDWR
jgi:RNA polymerase sigma factor (sigma-70 family)